MTRRNKPRAHLAARHDAAADTVARTRRAQPVMTLPTDGRFTHDGDYRAPYVTHLLIRSAAPGDSAPKRNGGRDSGMRRTAPGILPSWDGVTPNEDEGYAPVRSGKRGNAHNEGLWSGTDAVTRTTPNLPAPPSTMSTTRHRPHGPLLGPVHGPQDNPRKRKRADPAPSAPTPDAPVRKRRF